MATDLQPPCSADGESQKATLSCAPWLLSVYSHGCWDQIFHSQVTFGVCLCLSPIAGAKHCWQGAGHWKEPSEMVSFLISQALRGY